MTDPLNMRERPAMQAALDALDASRRKPTELDRPPPSTFPLTRAAKAALALGRKNNR